MTSLIQAKNLSIGYKIRRTMQKTIAADLSLNLNAGDLICLVGPNGCGKSTLLRTITGLLPPLSGTVHLGGRDVRALTPLGRAKLVSIVLTNPVRAGQLSVYDVCGLGRYPYTGWLGALTDEDRRQVELALDAVGIASFADRFLDELSDGERQKVMIARALAQDARLMILDEPTAYLDVPYRIEIMHILRNLAWREDRGILLSTHDLDLAMRTADRLWAISREGRFYCGAPEDLALDGVISEVFGIGGITYDAGCGQFQIPAHSRGAATITGENGKFRFWTERAMQRIGFTPGTGDDPAVRVDIQETEDGPEWEVRTPGDAERFDSLTDCTAWLRGRDLG